MFAYYNVLDDGHALICPPYVSSAVRIQFSFHSASRRQASTSEEIVVVKPDSHTVDSLMKKQPKKAELQMIYKLYEIKY